MAGRDVIDMREVEPRVHEARHPSRRRLDDDAAGRRRPHVARADGRRRVDDDRRQSIAPDHGLDQTLGRDFAALIGADPLAFGKRMVLGRGGALGELQSRDAAGVDDALDAGAQRLLHDEARSLDIVAADLFRVSRPKPIIGRGVKEKADAFQRRRQRGAIAEVALAHSVGGIEIGARARWTHQHADLVAAGSERGGDCGTEKAARARDQNGRRTRFERALGRHSNCACLADRFAVRRSNVLSAFTIHA